MDGLWLLALLILAVVVGAIDEKRKQKNANKGGASHSEKVETTQTQPRREPAESKNKETHKVAGITYRLDAFLELGEENPDYKMTKREIIDEGMTDQRIWKYDFYPVNVELVPEPENPHDPQAIKVVIDGRHIGYIKSGSCAHIHNLIKSSCIEKIDVKMGGGKYKCICEDYDENGNEAYTSKTDTVPYYAHITIFKK